ncbi:sugar ABC transporter ATP-binding protein [Pararobbsia alpina]|uniref:Ribose import ATP-binding protein RbsA n=1 Tax=Pararobbsia alpina TaxID=621374 RepID=A0A6S7BRA3_9BURK|nr:sugar ABC transporter ATP-binding protein [Pararobbsia alpina]CAB3792755.1 Ribose import ATP-binding protein RbsA [Pararobbsia alpina]
MPAQTTPSHMPHDRARPVLEMQDVSKRFGATSALAGVSLQVHAHEIHALMGENGAGKSTLMKVLAGVITPDAGSISMDGQTIAIDGPASARAHGINLIYQELSIAANLSVAQNVFMGSEPRSRFGLLDKQALHARTRQILDRLGASFAPETPAALLSIAEQQQVEIARALIHRSRVLIMDEPTAALSERETERLFGIIRSLREEGIAIIYISHRMDEVDLLADRVTVLRDGQRIGEIQKADIERGRIVQMMVGRPLAELFPREERFKAGDCVLEVERIASEQVHDVSFKAYKGEIVALAGLIGAGRTELARLVFGADVRRSGTIRVNGAEASIRRPRDAIRAGIAYVPEDRKGQGLLLDMSVGANMTMNVVKRFARFGMVNRAAMARVAAELKVRLNVKAASLGMPIAGLSGGNQQKALLARWLAIKPVVLILDEPTRGIDIGAKMEIYNLMRELAASGVAIVCISSDLPEVIGIADRVLVMREGRIAAELSRTEISQERVMAAALELPQADRLVVPEHIDAQTGRMSFRPDAS